MLLVDDHAVVREGLRAFLQLQPDIEVVGEADGGETALAVAARVEPDVVLMDLLMPDGDGIAAIRGLRAAQPKARVLVLSSYIDDAQVFSAIQAGAGGYQLKDIQPDALADAIRDVHAGRPALHAEAQARLMHRAADPPTGSRLTPRERDVLKLLAEGFPNRGDRPPPLRLREDCEDPRQLHPAEARGPGPYAGRPGGGAAEAAGLTDGVGLKA